MVYSCYITVQEQLELQDKHRSMLNEPRQLIKLNLCQCILRQDTNRASEALELADEVIEKNAEYAKAWFWKGKAKIEMGNLRGAKEDLLKAAKLAPQDRQVRLTLQGVKEKTREEDMLTRSTWLGLLQKSPMTSPSSPSSSQNVDRVWPSQRFIITICVAVVSIFISWILN